jgi:hypothetical protein
MPSAKRSGKSPIEHEDDVAMLKKFAQRPLSAIEVLQRKAGGFDVYFYL